MILETAELSVAPGHEAAFEAAVREAVPLFLASQGCRGVRLHRVVETPGLYRLLVDWETLEDHTVGFRGSEAFARWRALVSPHFAAPPSVTHSEEVLAAEGG
jgi:heme-degrading monooxygenase HmoA